MKKILIVEDHNETATVVQDYIRQFFPLWIIFRADSGKKAIEITLQEKPDVIILDIALTDQTSGIHVVREIAKSNLKPRIILVTALGNKASGHGTAMPGRPWLDQLQEHEKALVSRFFEKTYMSFGEFITEIAKAGEVPVPAGVEDL